MTLETRPISWIRASFREFETFPQGAKSICLAALTMAAEGAKADIGEEIWVVHAFQKKSRQGIKTPQREIDLIKDRLRRLKETLR